jgi:hypothetical protein
MADHYKTILAQMRRRNAKLVEGMRDSERKMLRVAANYGRLAREAESSRKKD